MIEKFEKDAEEYVKHWIVDEDDNALMQEAYKDGAEFGYNKANEWHYVKDELDTKSWKRCNKYLVRARFTTGVGNSDIPLLAYFDHYHQKWYVDRNYLSAFNVIAWKEIVLPELKESE